MSAAKKRSDESDGTQEITNPFEPDMTKANPAFDLKALLAEATTKAQDASKVKISIAERIKKAKENIARIQSMIAGLELKSQQQSGMVWVNSVIKPLVAELCAVLPNLKAELTPTYGLSGDCTLTMCQRGPSAGKKPECRSITFVSIDGSVAVRNFQEDTGEWNPGSIQAISNWNHPTVTIPVEKPIEFCIEHLR